MNLNTEPNRQKHPVSASAVVRIVIWSVVLLILAGLFTLGMLGSMRGKGGLDFFGSVSLGGYTYDDASAYSIGGDSFEDSSINELDIDWPSGDIRIIPTDDAFITISEDYDGDDPDYRLRWLIEDNELSIKFCKPYWMIGVSNRPSKTLTLYIPRTMLNAMREVDIDASDSRITFEGNAKEFQLDGVDVQAAITGHIGSLDMDGSDIALTFSGRLDDADFDGVDMTVDFTGTLGKANFDGVDTVATMRLTQADSIDVDTVDGEITLILSEDITGFAVSVDALAGNVLVNGYDTVSKKGYDEYWGDGHLLVTVDGLDAAVKIENDENTKG